VCPWDDAAPLYITWSCGILKIIGLPTDTHHWPPERGETMAWSSFHRGDYKRLRRNLTVALLEAEAMEPRIQFAFSRGLVPSDLCAKMGLVRLHLERADLLIREALDISIADTRQYYEIYAEATYTDDGILAA
jgi:hypothetical protein